MSTPRPIKILMICAHEPGLDPRIHWEAAAAADRFDVTVLGFNRDDRSLPARETVNGYQIVRLRRKEAFAFAYFWRLKDSLPVRLRLLTVVVLVAISPLLAPVEVVLRLARRGVRLVAGGSPRQKGRFRRLQMTVISKALLSRSRRIGRIENIVAVLQAQFATAAWQFWNHLRSTPDKPDIIHCNDLDTLLVGVLGKRRYHCRLIYDAHEFYPVSDPQGKRVDTIFFTALERFLIHQADAVVTVNPPLAAEMRNAYGLERVYSVPNAEPWSEIRPKPNKVSDMEQLAGRRTRFLFQGRFAPGRGINELIEGWTIVDGGRAALFLRGPDSIWRQAAMELAARLGLLGRSVYFLDAVEEDQLVAAAAEADVGIIPYEPRIINHRLSCPNKLSQYLHAGLMVIVNDLPYVKSVLIEAQAGLWYNSADLGTLAAAVHLAVDDPQLLRRSRENALRFAREQFNWQIQAKVLYALYNSQPGEGMPNPADLRPEMNPRGRRTMVDGTA